MASTAFRFLDACALLTLVDHDLELVEPAAREVDDMLAACHHPLTQHDMPAMARTTRDGLLTFLGHNPRGHSAPDPKRGIAPGYTFWLRLRPSPSPLPGSPVAEPPPIAMAGSVSLRLGHGDNLDLYLGHVGYHILPPARGHHYAERAVRLLLPLARMHGQRTLWITCNPENLASRRTCERLGAVFINTVPIPRENSLYQQGDRLKCRYRLDL